MCRSTDQYEISVSNFILIKSKPMHNTKLRAVRVNITKIPPASMWHNLNAT